MSYSRTYTLAQHTPRTWTFKPLSPAQRSCIGRNATAAYLAQVARGIVTVPAVGSKEDAAREWRHGEYLAVTGHEGLENCNQEHFRKLLAHFDAIIGTPARAARSFQTAMRTGPVKEGSGAASPHQAEDTHEGRELWRNLLTAALREYADTGITPGYAIALCRGPKFKKPGIDALTARELQLLTYDVRRNGQSRRRKVVSGQ